MELVGWVVGWLVSHKYLKVISSSWRISCITGLYSSPIMEIITERKRNWND